MFGFLGLGWVPIFWVLVWFWFFQVFGFGFGSGLEPKPKTHIFLGVKRLSVFNVLLAPKN